MASSWSGEAVYYLGRRSPIISSGSRLNVVGLSAVVALGVRSVGEESS